MTQEHEYRYLRLEDIQSSATNPRRTFDAERMKELTASVAHHGILQPVLVRQLDHQGWELVAGERRLRAAKAAKLTEIPVVVRKLTDTQALEIQVVENLQRDDLHPLEEAEGYQLLVKRHGLHVGYLAGKVGKSKTYIYARLKLLELPPAARRAFVAGDLSASVALLIARIPDRKLASQACEQVLAGWGDGAMSYREASDHIRGEFMLRLKGAPFPTDDATLVPAAGSCAKCPKRTGNQPELFDDVKSADVCTDPPCFARKRDAAWVRRKAEAKASGARVLGDDEAKKILRHGELEWRSPYVDLATPCAQDPKRRSWEGLLGKHRPTPIIARDPAGGLHELLTVADAQKALRAAGHKFPRAESGHVKSEADQASGAAERRRAELRRRTVRGALERIVAKAEAGPSDLARFWIVFAEVLAHSSWHDSVADLLTRRGWREKGEAFAQLRKRVRKMTARQARGVAVELLAARGALSSWRGDLGGNLTQFAKLYRVDLKAAAAHARKEASTPRRRKKAAKKSRR